MGLLLRKNWRRIVDLIFQGSSDRLFAIPQEWQVRHAGAACRWDVLVLSCLNHVRAQGDGAGGQFLRGLRLHDIVGSYECHHFISISLTCFGVKLVCGLRAERDSF